MSMTLDDLKYFSIVAKTKNVTRASEIIGVSQPALSYSLKRLETELGMNLVVRLKNGVELTKAGNEFSKKINQLILSWEESRNILKDQQQKTKALFSFGAHPSVALYGLETVCKSIFNVYPQLSLKLVHGLSREITGKIIDWELDFALAINPTTHPDLVIKELGVDLVQIFKSKNSTKKIIYDPSLMQSQAILKKTKNAGYDFDEFIESSNLEVIAKLTAAGFGHGLLPTRVAAQYPKLKPLAKGPIFKDRICFVYRKDKHNNQVSRSLIEIIGRIKL